jgi:hypothetical protein
MLLFEKNTLWFRTCVRTPHDRPRTQFDHSSCLRFFIYDILCVSVSTKKLHQSAHVCHVWTVDTANQQIHSISVMFFHLIDLPWFSWNRLSKFLREQNITFPTGSEACESSGTRRYWKRLLAPMLCAMLEDCYGCAIESVDGAIKQMDIQLHCAIAV